MKNTILAGILALGLVVGARADGVTDILVDPAVGFTIGVPGSYRLAGDVTMTAGKSAVVISAANVTLDLNGHTITGAAVNAVNGIGSLESGVVVLNGAVKGWGGNGVRLGGRGVVRGVRATNCNIGGGQAGILVENESVVEDCVVSDNAAATGAAIGIRAGSKSRIVHNIVSNNTSASSEATGIAVVGDSIIADNVVTGNKGVASGVCFGIAGGPRCVIRGNVVSDNDNSGTGNATGIQSTVGSIIERNTCTDQTTGLTGSGVATGIDAVQCLVVDNECVGNRAGAGSNGTGIGVRGGGRNVIRNNRCEGNNGAGTGFSAGVLVATNCQVEGNYCTLNTGGAASHGIRVTNAGNLIAGNTTTDHTHGGIIFTTNAASNRCHSNQCDETEVIESTAGAPFNAVAPSSLGAGDLANVLY